MGFCCRPPVGCFYYFLLARVDDLEAFPRFPFLSGSATRQYFNKRLALTCPIVGAVLWLLNPTFTQCGLGSAWTCSELTQEGSLRNPTGLLRSRAVTGIRMRSNVDVIGFSNFRLPNLNFCENSQLPVEHAGTVQCANIDREISIRLKSLHID